MSLVVVLRSVKGVSEGLEIIVRAIGVGGLHHMVMSSKDHAGGPAPQQDT